MKLGATTWDLGRTPRNTECDSPPRVLGKKWRCLLGAEGFRKDGGASAGRGEPHWSTNDVPLGPFTKHPVNSAIFQLINPRTSSCKRFFAAREDHMQ